jgi:hypothetical protein
MPVQEILFCLGCSSRPSTKFQFQFLCPYCPASWGQAAVLGRLSFSVCVSLASTLSNVIILFSLQPHMVIIGLMRSSPERAKYKERMDPVFFFYLAPVQGAQKI